MKMKRIIKMSGFIPMCLVIIILLATSPAKSEILSRTKGEAYGYTRICALKDNKKAAYTFTTDDGMYTAVKYYNEDFKRLNLRGSMALIAGKLNGLDENFKTIISEGHFDVTNHSMTHPKFAEISDRETLENEINGSQTLLQTKFSGQDVITMVNPYGSNSELAESIIEQHHFAARNGGGGYNYLNPTDYEWFHLKLISTYNYGLSRPYNAEYLNSCLNTALLHSNWIIIMAHGIGNDQNSISKEDITKHFDYLASKLDSVWCGTFNEVTKYIREKQHAVLKINQAKSSGIIIKLTHDLNSNIFNFPLTLKTNVPASWKIGTIEQNGLSKKVHAKSENGYNYIVYDAIPNTGDIKLSKF